MASDIKTQIENINNSLAWIRRHHPEHYEQRFLQLVEERRKLRKIAEAEKDNPAIAAYGVSQVGKSYLMSNMLQQEVTLPDGSRTIKPFEVEADGIRYNFINDMNPITTNTEATGVVTRFSSFSRDESRYSKEYPVLMKCLSIADMTLVICDGYFHDVDDPTTDSRNEIDEHANELYLQYRDREPQRSTPLTADDVMEMKYYFRKYIKNAQEINKSSIFDRIALVVNRIPVEDYVSVFSYLWNGEANLSKLYKRVLSTLHTLNFQREIYLPVDAVLHQQKNENTIMSVQCLDGLLDDQTEYKCDAYLKQTDGTFLKRPDMSKSALSSVCAEVVFRISREFLEGSGSYDMTYVAPNIQSQLTQGGVNYDLLKKTDLLDFPGARSRTTQKISTLQQPKILTTVLLRGKVAYLFNKYCEARAINILLFCHHGEKNEVTNLYIILNEWVNQYVGTTPEERARTLQLAGGISPLFYIATKFNMDMAENQNPSANERVAIDGRWSARFMKVLYKECFQADSVDWVKNWTQPGQFFQNSYLLRDFKYSGPKGSKLFDGFATEGKETNLLVSRDYLDLLRDSFCESDDAAMFFANRELAWDVASTMNNDGSLYIIENLTRAASAMGRVREAQFKDTCAQVLNKVLTIMKEYYISDDTTELLAENIRKANGIFRELEFTCQDNPGFFGHLLKALQLTEAQSFKEVHRLIPELGRAVHDTSKIVDYELIRKRCNNFEGCPSEASKWQMFIQTYRFTSQEEAAEYLKSRGVDERKLFQGDTVKRKNSSIIADDLVTLWQDYISSVQFMNAFAGDGLMDEIVLANLVACITNTAHSVHLTERIEQEIADYVDILNTSNINEDLIADMIATTISDFVIDFGFRYLESDQIQTSRRVSTEMHLPCFVWTERERKEHYEEEEMTALFNEILSSAGRYTPAYEANYNTWLEYMYVAFIAHINVPDYNREANEQIKLILDAIKQ